MLMSNVRPPCIISVISNDMILYNVLNTYAICSMCSYDVWCDFTYAHMHHTNTHITVTRIRRHTLAA